MVANQGQAPISNIQILFNKNSFGLKPDGQLGLTVPAGGSATGRIAVGTDGPVALMDPIMSIQVAVKNNISGDSFYFYQVGWRVWRGRRVGFSWLGVGVGGEEGRCRFSLPPSFDSRDSCQV